MRRSAVLSAIVGLAISLPCLARTELKLEGEVGQYTVRPIFQVVEWLIAHHEDEIVLTITSPGGEIEDAIALGMLFQSAKKTRIICVVRDYAYSAAFYIFSQCHERYAYSNAILMWHRIKIGVPGLHPPEELGSIVLEVAQLQAIVNLQVEKALGVPFEKFQPYFDDETFLIAPFFTGFAPNFLHVIWNRFDVP